ncbi:type II toxin-antitoxin system RelE/ParE family toxin [Neorhizobium lilium]|uniref:Type II toxin-antitoxin system RelE/ParE family toxin n=1 Tax=Neorhizobium lilium TaxID=2503024 RepID=A0A444LG22_9HYPH|nr:type II toxin-antitoxin system RelE/ParE family toxin [Neorhizobium lilium]RWX77124.1 type II toxin-antitoxin system RelE/ParE family toxin [Neorhizobium lilium]
MIVRWASAAIQDRADIFDYIFERNPYAARRMDALFSAAVSVLADFPGQGKPGAITGTRELIPHESYRILYETDDKTVWILAIVHTSRQWPPASE